MNMTSKKIKKSELSISVVLIIGILGVLNFFSSNLFARIDLTDNAIYSISDASKKTARQLDDVVNIKAYFSENLPNQYLGRRQEVRDLLEEYANYSNGKIRVEFIDPKDDDKLKQDLYMIGIQPLTFTSYARDKSELVNGYMAIAISYGDYTEVIPTVINTGNLEYKITTAVKKVTSEELGSIGYLVTQGTADQEDLQNAMGQLRELYDVIDVKFEGEKKDIPSSVDTLLIIGPKEEFTDDQLKTINSFVSRGGALLVAVDGVNVGQDLSTGLNQTNIGRLLEEYGFKINKDLVADRRSGVAPFNQGFITFTVEYPFWPMINSEGFDRENGAVSDLERVVLPWASSIEIDKDKLGEAKALARTTKAAKSHKDNFNLAPQGANPLAGGNKVYELAAVFNGSVKNPYGEGDMNARLAIVGDSDFMRDGFLRAAPENLIFFQNLVDSLSFDQDLISIRSKDISVPPIMKELSDNAKSAIKYLNIFGLTLVVVAIGLVRYFLRRRSRFLDEI
jgi:gliding-associated putative ABC transporter substrate-binding component GldG